MSTKIRIRRDTSTGLRSVNPILDQGEPSLETDTGLIKIGDGATAYRDLAPAQSGVYAPLARAVPTGGSDGQVLQLVAGVPTWNAASGYDGGQVT